MRRHPLSLALGAALVAAAVAGVLGDRPTASVAGVSCGDGQVETSQSIYEASATGAATPDLAVARYLEKQGYELDGRLEHQPGDTGPATWRVTSGGRTTVLARVTYTGSGWLVPELVGCADVLRRAREDSQ